MTAQQAIDLFGPVIVGTMLPTVTVLATAVLSGLTKRAAAWLDAHGQAQQSKVITDASIRVQAAMQNAAGQIALDVQNGNLKLSDPAALNSRLHALGAKLVTKLPDAIAILKPTSDAIVEGIRGKITNALVPPEPTAAATPPASDQAAPQAPVVVPAVVPAQAQNDVAAQPTWQPDRRDFFASVRTSIFGGRLVQSQVDGCNNILDYWNNTTPNGDVRELAYALATAFWETGRTMQPIEEYGRGKGRFYGSTPFYGRGLAQITTEDNYRRLSAVAGCDLVANPERALEWPIALRILFIGMTMGMFTGKRFSDFFDNTKADPVGARQIINGKDRAEEIASIYSSFLAALNEAADDGKIAA